MLPWFELRNALLAFVLTGTVGIVGSVAARVLAALQRAALIRVCDSIAAVVSTAAVAACATFDVPIWVYLVALFAPITSTWLMQLGYVMVRYPYLSVGPKDFDAAAGLRFLRQGFAFAVLSMGWAIAYTLGRHCRCSGARCGASSHLLSPPGCSISSLAL